MNANEQSQMAGDILKALNRGSSPKPSFPQAPAPTGNAGTDAREAQAYKTSVEDYFEWAMGAKANELDARDRQFLAVVACNQLRSDGHRI